MRGSNHQTFEKLDEDIGVDAAFFLDHEAHVTTRRDRRHAFLGLARVRTDRNAEGRRLAKPIPEAFRSND